MKAFPNSRSQRFLTFFPKNFIILAPTSKSTVYFKVIFAYDMKNGGSASIQHFLGGYPVVPKQFVEKTVLFPL